MRVAGIKFVQGRNSYSDSDGTKYGLAIHNTSNTASAADEASYATRRTDGVSSHFYCDSTQVIQSLDTSARAGHAGSSQGNQNAIAVEITGTNSWTRQQWLDRVDWAELGRVLSTVCRTYGIAVRRASVAEMKANPKVRAIYSHDDMRRAWGGTTHNDPGSSFPWDKLLASIKAGGEDDDMAISDPDVARIADAAAKRILSDGGPQFDISRGYAIVTGATPVPKTGEQNVLHAKLDALLLGQQGSDGPAIIAAIAADGDKTRAALAGLKTAILAELPDGDGPVSRDDLVAALTTVLGSVDGATPAS